MYYLYWRNLHKRILNSVIRAHVGNIIEGYTHTQFCTLSYLHSKHTILQTHFEYTNKQTIKPKKIINMRSNIKSKFIHQIWFGFNEWIICIFIIWKHTLVALLKDFFS